ncbi:hypothetical protein BJV74DRAFT_126006 [Russula compacta]|nr:hypothetical protein BJV74DRAFT_126006 [Russula compacta]
MHHPLRFLTPIALDVLVLPLSAQPSLGAIHLSSVLLTRKMTKQILFLPSFHIPVSTCPRESDLQPPFLPMNLRLNASHPRAKYFDLAHASQSLASARRRSKSRSRRSLLRSIYLAFLHRLPQMTPSCFMVVHDTHSRQSQQMRAKHRCSRAHLPVRENSCRHSIAAHLIFPFQASPLM